MVFRRKNKLTNADFHHKNIDILVKITVTFISLSEEAKKELSDYVRQDKLIVSAVAKYNSNNESAEITLCVNFS